MRFGVHGVFQCLTKSSMVMENPNFDEERSENLPAQFGKEESDSSKDRRWERILSNAMLGGVFAGLAEYVRVDVSFIRIAFVLLCFLLGPLTVLLYLFAWIFVPLKSGESMDDSSKRVGQAAKFGCMGCSFFVLFPLVIIVLLLIIPSIYVRDLSGLMSDPNFFACDDISWDIRYSPNLTQLMFGAFFTFFFPVIVMIAMHGKEEFWGVSKRWAYIFTAVVFFAGIMMIISALTAN